jgi:hypothetical protein
MMNSFKFYLRRANKSSSPIKNKILAYVIYNEDKNPTAKQIAKGLKLKFSTVRSYLNILYHEAEINHKDYYFDSNDKVIKTKELVYFIEREFNEQPSLMCGLFMDKKDFKIFKASDTYQEILKDFRINKSGHLIRINDGFNKSHGEFVNIIKDFKKK